MDDNKSSRHGTFAVVGFNVMVILCMFLFAWLRGGMANLHFIDFVGAILLATIAGGDGLRSGNGL